MIKTYLFLLFLLCFSATNVAQSHVWTQNNGDTNWFNPINWSAGTVPNAGSDVEIPDGFAVTVATNAAFANSITLVGSAMLFIENNITVTNTIAIPIVAQLIFKQGALQATEILNFGTIITQTPQLKDLINTQITNHNSFKIETSNNIRLFGSVIITNLENASIEITANGGFTKQTGANAALHNFGHINKFDPSGEASSFYLIIDTINHGVIDVATNNQLLFLTNEAHLHNTLTGTLTGTGVFDITSPFTNEGTISPGGNTIGTLMFTNTFNTTENTTLRINIDTDNLINDNIVLTGATQTITGNLEVITTGNELLPEEEFTIFSATNGFTSCVFPEEIISETTMGSDLDGYVFSVTCNSTTVVLKAIAALLGQQEIASRKIIITQNNNTKTATVYLNNAVNHPARISLIDVNGRSIFTELTQQDTFSFSTAVLQQGLYFVHINTNRNNETLKIGVQH